MKTFYYLVILTIILSTCCESANILAFPWFPGYSHFIIIESLLKELAKQGHNVTVVSHFPQKVTIENYNDVHISNTMPLVTNNFSFDYAIQYRDPFQTLLYSFTESTKNCEWFFKETAVQELTDTIFKFDLVITEDFSGDCFAVFAYKHKAPLITIATTVSPPWAYKRLANPDNPAYITSLVPAEKSFSQRFYNTVFKIATNLGHYFLVEIPQNRLVKKYFGESTPPLGEIVRSTSVYMTNSHFSFRQIQPLLPNFVEIGGIHLKPTKQLPKDFKQILDNAINGAIVVSLGSVLRFSTFPENMLKDMIKAFSRFPYLVILKMEDPVIELPPNVIARKWVPVRDILEHPNIKLLIMHGGMATTIETVDAGVPVIGIPFFNDQSGNIQNLVDKGAGILIEIEALTEKSIYNAINEIFSNPDYQANMKKLSAIFKDKPRSPLETAIFWVEYVLRHDGAPHLKSPALKLTWYQLQHLDLISLIFVTFLTFVYAVHCSGGSW